jgi:hypothetical protein
MTDDPARPASPDGEAAPSAPPPLGPVPSAFAFEHKIFRIEGVWFAKTPDRAEVAMFLPMSGFVACLPLKAVRKGFDIVPGSEDDRMLGYISRAADHLGRIVPGDPIPTEVISGEASWTISDLDRLKGRSLLLDILHVELGQPAPGARSDEAIRDALQGIAHLLVEKLGDGVPAGEAIRRFEMIAAEYAYVEALRQRFHLIEDIRVAVLDPKQQRRAPRMRDAADRIVMLLKEPTRIIVDSLGFLKSRLRPMIGAVRDPMPAVDAIRRTRDELHIMLTDWEPMFSLWASGPEEGHVGNKQADGTYRFLAERYLGRRVWRRAGDHIP